MTHVRYSTFIWIEKKMLDLSNKISIITGASSGIGRATAILFSQLGSRLALVGRDEKSLDETIKTCSNQADIVKIVGDLTYKETINKLVTETVKRFGSVTTLVNNAAVFGLSSVKTTSEADYDKMMNVNLKSPMLLTQACLPYLIKEADRGASIVNVSSIAGTRSFPNLLPYSMSKAALDQFTKCTALELAEHRIRVNSVKWVGEWNGILIGNFWMV